MANQNENVSINVGSFFDARGFKLAETALDKLTKSVKNVAGALGVTYGTRAIVNFGKASVKAFAADDNAAKVLTQTLNNLGLGFASGSKMVNDYISRLEKQTGVLDDELRPAMDRLLRATGDITKSQELLSLALDISAGTGKSVAQVSQSLQKAYLGQTQALGRLGVGLTKAELTSSNFEEIQSRLTVLFSGQAIVAANSYGGSLNKLAVAANNAKEAIGKGLVDALSILNGDSNGGLNNTVNLIDKASVALETFIRRFGVGLAQGKALLTGNFKAFGAIGQAEVNRNKQVSGVTPAVAAELKKAALEKAAAKRAKEQAALTAKNTKAVKEQTALQKANALFDMQQIELVAALKGKLSDEDRKRAELQLAVLQENTSEASKLAAQVATAQGLTKELVAYYSGLKPATDPFSGWLTSLDAIQKKASEIVNLSSSIAQVGPLGGLAAGVIAGVNPTKIPSAALDTQGIYNGSSTATMSTLAQVGPLGGLSAGVIAGVNPTINITVQGSVTTQQDLVSAVRDGLLNNSLSGKQAALSRSQGTFGG